MIIKRASWFVLMLSVVMMVACSGMAQKPQGQIPEVKATESSSVFIIGRIEYLYSEGGYFIRGDHPYAKIFRIANQNLDLLEPVLKTKDKHVTIEGRLEPGTNIVFIERLWGKPYAGK
jgi:hypothetical protein